MTVTCVVCGIRFSSTREGATYNAPRFCSGRCKSADKKRKNPEKVKAARRKTHLKHREKDLENNRRWWRKNRNKLKMQRAEYRGTHKEKFREYAKKSYWKLQIKNKNRATR